MKTFKTQYTYVVCIFSKTFFSDESNLWLTDATSHMGISSKVGEKIEWVKRGKNFQLSQGKKLVGCWAGSTSSPPALTQHHQPGLSFALLHRGPLVQGYPSAPLAALESLMLDTVFPEYLGFKVGLNLDCSNSLAFDIDEPSLITECLIRDCI